MARAIVDPEVCQGHTLCNFAAQFALASGSILLLKLRDQFHAAGKQLLGEGLVRRPQCRLRIFSEKLQILAIVEDVKELFIDFRPKQIRSQTRTAPYHLKEFSF